MRKLSFLLSSVFLTAFILYSSGCGGSSQAQIVTTTAITTQPVQTTTAITTTAEPAAFSVSNLTISPDVVARGAGTQEFYVYVTVTNSGGIQGTYEVVLYVDGIGELTQSVTLDAGASEEVEFRVISHYIEGNYNINSNGLLAELDVT